MGWIAIALKALPFVRAASSHGAESLSQDRDKISSMIGRLATVPIKVLATFLFAPVMLVFIIFTKGASLTRRSIAVAGLCLGGIAIVSIPLTTAALFGYITVWLSFWSALLYTVGLLVVDGLVFVSLAFVFNLICYVFVLVSRRRIIEHVSSIIRDR